jgi:transposase
MGHIEGRSRTQTSLLPPALEDYVPREHVVRVIDAFVEGLPLAALGFERTQAAATGRPGYHAAGLLKLYLYGYQQCVRSSRSLMRECERNVEVMWLVQELKPSYKTIACFRSDHAEALVSVCEAFVQLCRRASLLGGKTVAIDGTKVDAVASRKRHVTKKKLAKAEAKVKEKIQAYLASLDEADASEEDETPDPEALKALLENLQSKETRLKMLGELLGDASQVVEGEPEAKLMHTPKGPRVAYNAQIAVDAEHHLVVHAAVTNEGNDKEQLLPMALGAKAALEVERLEALTDTGYSSGAQLAACEANGIEAAVSRPRQTNTRDGELYGPDAFSYRPETDDYVCPAGQVLRRQRDTKAGMKRYWQASACRGCALKDQCTRGTYREVTRTVNEEVVDAAAKRMTRERCIERSSLVEHPHGTMKWMMGVPRFLVRGLRKVRGEYALVVTGYNLKRALSVLGFAGMMDMVRG